MENYIPLDKSWINRMGVLDLVNGYEDIKNFLENQKNLSDDLLALKRAVEVWKTDQSIDVGESGTLYRLLKFASWKLNLNKKFVINRTLQSRKIVDDPSIVNLSQTELLTFDNGTSQWASAKALLGDSERIPNSPFKLVVTYEAIEHWKEKRNNGKMWEPRYDETISKQAHAFKKILKGEDPSFISEQAEDFCFAYLFGYITLEEGEKRWPALRGHESDRIVEIEKTLKQAMANEPITSKDHRVVQGIVMWGKVYKVGLNILYPESVNKTWPQFWEFLKSELN